VQIIKFKKENNHAYQRKKTRGSNCMLSRRPLKKPAIHASKEKGKYDSTVELERGMVHQLPHGIRQQR
jgi:hypothetical protein